MGVSGNVTFLPGNALDLPFEDQTFDGALFSDSLELTGNIGRALSEAERILRPGGIIAITLVPFSEDTERISACITDDAHNVPVIRYEVTTSVPPTGRRYRVCLRPESDSGRRIKSSCFKAGRCEFSREELEEMLGASGLGSVTRIVYSCVSGITPADLREELLSLGFEQVTFWHPPSATEFASALHDEGYLHSISPEDHRALVRALARASRTGGSGSKVSAKKASRTEPTAQQHAPADADKPRR
jgi:ubiquinone/menaquinone biosynthesis C-methylase UbiE